MGRFAKFYFKPRRGERVHTEVETAQDDSCGLYGTVTREGKAVPDAAVLLFDAEDGALLASCLTDGDGAFAFASLEAERLYLAKVYVDGVKIRELEISV